MLRRYPIIGDVSLLENILLTSTSAVLVEASGDICRRALVSRVAHGAGFCFAVLAEAAEFVELTSLADASASASRGAVAVRVFCAVFLGLSEEYWREEGKGGYHVLRCARDMLADSFFLLLCGPCDCPLRVDGMESWEKGNKKAK